MRELPETITLRWLQRHYACEPAIAIFKKLFGDEMPLTEANVRKFFRKAERIDRAGELCTCNWREWFAIRLGGDHTFNKYGFSAQKFYATLRKEGR